MIPPKVDPRAALENKLLTEWERLLGRQGLNPYDSFIDHGGTRDQAVAFCRLLEQKFGGFMHPQLLVTQPTVKHLAHYLVELKSPPKPRPRTSVATWRAGRDRILTNQVEPVLAERNPSMALVLCPPRSGSTLLRIMLAGHPQLLAPPELDLMMFCDMAERKRTCYNGWFDLMGVDRTVMELWGVGPEEAAEMVEKTCREEWSIPKFYGWLQERARNRLLVDKTPSYSMDIRYLQRAENWFQSPRYIYLTRHPLAVIRSWQSFRLEQILIGPPRETAEMMWLLCHETILEFLKGVEPERYCQVAFEDLVVNPRAEMEKISATLGVPFEPAMLTPYVGKRMTDGIAGIISGDRKIFQFNQIDPTLAAESRRKDSDPVLAPETVAVAQRLGYTDL